MDVEIIRSRRKTISIEIKSDLKVTVRAPLHMSDKEIENFIAKKSAWIEKNLSAIKAKAADQSKPEFTPKEIEMLIKQGRCIIPARVEYFAKMMGITYNKISVKKLVSRWGSCSSGQNLSFNCLLVLCPPEVCDYVIIHELCHLKELNHSRRFWAEVARYYPNYKESDKWLKTEGIKLVRRLRQNR